MVQTDRLIVLIALIAILPVLITLDGSLANSSIPDNEITTRQTGANNSSASAAITITMTGMPNE